MIRQKTIYLMGGLGNVLFQLNYLYNLRSLGMLTKVNCTLLENSYLTKKLLRWTDHRTLNILLELQLLSDIDLEFDGYINIFAGALSKFLDRDVLSARYFGLTSPSINNISADHLFGYFHKHNSINKQFIKKVRGEILRRIDFTEFSYVREALNIIGNSFVVHVRGGDYAYDASFAISNDYYRKALSGQEKCYILTNDIEFSKNLFSGIEIKYNFLNTKTALEDFIILALSKNKILANSTFSWWAAELGNLEGTIIQKDPFFDHINSWYPDSKVTRRLIPYQSLSSSDDQQIRM